MEQTRAIRRHEIVGKFLSARKTGALWYANTDVRNYPIGRPLHNTARVERTYFGSRQDPIELLY